MKIFPGYLDRTAQEALVAAVADIIAQAPLYAPRMPNSGSPFSVRMTNCGPLGWVSDHRGYRYQPQHPASGAPWPPMPPVLLAAWQELADYPHPPEACLINVYAPTARMGLHQDRDEQDFAARWYRYRSARPACFASAERRGATRPGRSGSPPATHWCSADTAGWHSMAWIG